AMCTVPIFFGGNTPATVTALCMSLIYTLLSMVNTSALSIFPLSFRERGTVAEVSGWLDLFTYFGSALGAAVYGFIADGAGYFPVVLLWGGFCILGCLTTLPLIKKRNAGK
ncbi:MAG: hypothetical protein MJ082_04100, partial [Clostridia bacterium]|nr:hypothetical protein [Clostridia bacterium]